MYFDQLKIHKDENFGEKRKWGWWEMNEQTRVPSAQEEWKWKWAFGFSSLKRVCVGGGGCQPWKLQRMSSLGWGSERDQGRWCWTSNGKDLATSFHERRQWMGLSLGLVGFVGVASRMDALYLCRGRRIGRKICGVLRKQRAVWLSNWDLGGRQEP